MKLPKVSLIILNWNGWKDTLACVNSLSSIAYPNYELIIVDNGSSDESVKKIALWTKNKKNIRFLINEKNYGYAKGNNIAIRNVLKKGKSSYILVLNNDTLVEKNFLIELVTAAEKDKNIG